MNIPFNIKEKVPLLSYNTWHIDGFARWLAEPTLEELPLLFRWAFEQEIPIYFLGRGSNVLIDDNGGYWDEWFKFLRDSLFKRGLISGEDFGLFTITRDYHEAVAVIDEFYRNYHSMRYVGKKLVIRLNKQITQEQCDTLISEFGEILAPDGTMILNEALPEEHDQPDLHKLPRLIIDFNQRSFGLLSALIRRINVF